MELFGSVLNVVDFGVFVDIGLHDSGLVHVSQLANGYVRDPHEVAAVGDIVKVWVLEIDKTRHRVSLTMIAPGSKREDHAQRHKHPPHAHPRPPPRPARPTAPHGRRAAAARRGAAEADLPNRPANPLPRRPA